MLERRSISRRQFLSLAGATGGAAILAACAPVPAAAPTPTAPAEAAPQAEAQRKEVVSWLGGYTPTEWTSRSAEHTVVVNSTRILAQRFEEANPTIKIVWNQGPGGDDLFAWMSAGAASGQAPDLTWNTHNYAVQNGWAVAIDDYLNMPNPYAPQYKAWRDIFWPEYMKSLKQPDGHEYCAPLDSIYPNIEVGLAYNKETLDKMGLKVPATWKDEMEVAKALKEAGNGLSPWPPEKDTGNCWPLALQVLPSMMQSVCPEMDLNKDKFIGIEEALPAYKAGIIGPKTPIYQRAFDEMYQLATYWIDGFATTDLDLMWREGKIGLTYAGSWDFSRIANDPNVTFERGFIPPPLPSSQDIPSTATQPGAYDPPRTTAGDGSVPGELMNAVQGAETAIIGSAVKAHNNMAETINWWQFITAPDNNAFMVNENQNRISSAKDAALGSIWKGIASSKLPLYDYSIAWWGQGFYWDNNNFNTWRKIFMAWITGQIDRETHFARQEQEWQEASARYEAVLKEQMNKKPS